MGNAKPEQVERFKQAARELGCDEDEVAFDRALKQMKHPESGSLDRKPGEPGVSGETATQ